MKIHKSSRAEITYNDLAQVKRLINLKIAESMPFAANFVPSYIQSAQDCFMWLKTKTVYQLDPPNFELLQSFQSLIHDNYHGIPGAGDCDCLTIAGAATLATRKKAIPYKVVYSGNGKNPTHVFLYADGVPFDLTHNRMGEVSPYKRFDF